MRAEVQMMSDRTCLKDKNEVWKKASSRNRKCGNGAMAEIRSACIRTAFRPTIILIDE